MLFLLLLVIAVLGKFNAAAADESSTTDNDTATTTPPPPPTEPKLDWGTYHDPKNIFCGDFDCYKILGFDFENFGKNVATRKEITKNYRSLSREWHPDKSKHKNAKEKFVKIARAYEVLTDNNKRKEYDFMRYNQEAYFQKYGSSVLWSYAPKSDATFIVIILVLIGNAFAWFAQKTRWENVANRLVKATVEDWSFRKGGSQESKHLRDQAVKILQERESEEEKAKKEKDEASATAAAASANGKAKTTTKSLVPKAKAKKEKKVPGKERKKQEEENITPIVWELVNKMDDFGGGFHKPTWKDLLIVSMAKLPVNIALGTILQIKFQIRRIQKIPLSDDEKASLAERAVGPITWEFATDDGKTEMIKRELWKMENLVEWKEEQEFEKLSGWEKKEARKQMKKGSKQS